MGTPLRAIVCLSLLTASLAGGPVSIAAAQSAVASERFVARQVDGKLEIRDGSTNELVFQQWQYALVNNSECRVQSQVTPVPGGVDLVHTFTNVRSTPALIGQKTLGYFKPGPWADLVDLRMDTQIKRIRANAQGRDPGIEFKYPEWMYSPTIVFMNDRYIVGVSFMYPIIEYKHDLHLGFGPVGGSAQNPDWHVFCFNNEKIAPGQSRTYRISVRVVPRDRHWLETVVPYRDFFRQTYGPVRYVRDGRPIMATSNGEPHVQGPQNPWGFATPPNERPDLYGWGASTRRWSGLVQNFGFQRMMIWKPTGLYANGANATFPFRFMTRMNDFEPMRRSTGELRTLGQRVDLGFWWGTSMNIDRGWSPQGMVPLNPDNPEHVRLGFAELDMAVDSGAKIIGLDAFIHNVKPWDAYRWMIMMRDRHPQVKFVTEPYFADFFHVVSGTWAYASDVETPKVMADFLVPGHETWGGLMYNMLQEKRGRPLNVSDRRWEIQRVARMGYTPVVFDYIDIKDLPDAVAAESWNTTVPPALRLPVGNGSYTPTGVTQPTFTTGGSSTPTPGGSGSGGSSPGGSTPGSPPGSTPGSGSPGSTPPATTPPGGSTPGSGPGSGPQGSGGNSPDPSPPPERPGSGFLGGPSGGSGGGSGSGSNNGSGSGVVTFRGSGSAAPIVIAPMGEFRVVAPSFTGREVAGAINRFRSEPSRTPAPRSTLVNAPTNLDR